MSADQVKRLMSFRDLAPALGSLLSTLIYVKLRSRPIMQLGGQFFVPLYIFLSALLSLPLAFIIVKAAKKGSRRQRERSERLNDPEKRRRAFKELKKNNRLFVFVRIVLLFIIIGMPFALREIARPIILLAYPVALLMYALIIFIFPFAAGWRAEFQLKKSL